MNFPFDVITRRGRARPRVRPPFMRNGHVTSGGGGVAARPALHGVPDDTAPPTALRPISELM